MAEVELPNDLGDGRLGFASEEEVDRFVDTLEKFERGDLAPDAWRAFRLVHGVYGQRQEGPMMVRVKIPQGVLTVGQLLALGDVAENWSTGKGHVTTRQNVQFQDRKSTRLNSSHRCISYAVFCLKKKKKTRHNKKTEQSHR